MEKYSSSIETQMKLFYDNLSEKDKRHYAAVEAIKLGHGGVQYSADLFECSRQTIAKGLQELKEDSLKNKRTRKTGGGRKSYEQKHPDINDIFLKGNKSSYCR